MNLRRIIKSLSDLEKKELKRLLLLEEVSVDSENIDKNSVNNFSCPHCQGYKIHKNGHVRRVQRYKCRECGKTFSLRTNTLLHGTKKNSSLWSAYLDLLFEQKSVRHISKQLEIGHTTAFYWRHKVLNALRALIERKKPIMKGIVEADETYLPLSFKGQKSALPREAKKRGSAAPKRGISKEQVCVLVATDRTKNSHMHPVCLGRLRSKHLEEQLGNRISRSSVLVTDKHSSYIPFCKHQKISHKRLARSNQVKGDYHIQTVNSLHSHMKDHLRPYKGVATKYLTNYLILFEWTRRGFLELSQTMEATSLTTCDQLRLAKMPLT